MAPNFTQLLEPGEQILGRSRHVVLFHRPFLLFFVCAALCLVPLFALSGLLSWLDDKYVIMLIWFLVAGLGVTLVSVHSTMDAIVTNRRILVEAKDKERSSAIDELSLADIFAVDFLPFFRVGLVEARGRGDKMFRLILPRDGQTLADALAAAANLPGPVIHPTKSERIILIYGFISVLISLAIVAIRPFL